MTRKTLEMAKNAYIKNAKDKQKYYGIDNHDLGQMEKWVTSFANYLDYLIANNIEGTEAK